MWKVLSALFIVSIGCAPGTDEPPQCPSGDNFTNPRFDGDAIVADDHVEATFVWDQGVGVAAELPDSYYESMENQTFDYLGNRTAKLTLSPLGGEASRDYSVDLEAEDRRGFVDCTHPGTEDRYFLSIEFTVAADGTITAATFANEVSLGNI